MLSYDYISENGKLDDTSQCAKCQRRAAGVQANSAITKLASTVGIISRDILEMSAA